MLIPGRHANTSDYRYGFNGMEKDDELKGEGNSLDFGARMYDPRVGRWFKLDPIPKVFQSNYNFANSNPIIFVDPDGGDDYYFDRQTKSWYVIRTGAPHKFYTIEYTDNGDGTSVGLAQEKSITDQEIKNILWYNKGINADVFKHRTEDEGQIIYNLHNDRYSEQKANVIKGTLAVPGAVIFIAEVVPVTILKEVGEYILEELTGIPYIPLNPDPTDFIDPLTHRVGKEGLEKAEREVVSQEFIDNGVRNVEAPFKAAKSGAKYNKMNLGEAVITKKHHNWNKIFGNKKITLSDVQPYVDKALKDGTWRTTGTLRGKGGKVIGDKIELIQNVDGHDIWVGGMKDLNGNIIVNNAAVKN